MTTSYPLLVWEHAHIQRPILLKTWARFHPATFVLKFQLGNHMVFTNKISKEKLLGGTAGVFCNWLTFRLSQPLVRQPGAGGLARKDDGRSHNARARAQLGHTWEVVVI